MNRTTSKWLGLPLLVFTFALAPAAHAQYPGYVTNSNDTGLPSYGAYVSSGIDTVNLLNGGISLNIPILSRKGRGIDTELHFDYQSKQWVVDTSIVQNVPYATYTTYYNWRLDSNAGWNIRDNLGTSIDWVEQIYTLDPGCPYTYSEAPQVLVRSNWAYTSPDGSKHQLPLRKNYPYVGPGFCSQNAYGENYVAHTDDGHVQVDITSDGLTDHSGIMTTRANGAQGSAFNSFAYKDTNGNTCCGLSSGWITDTLGRPVYKYRTISSTETAIDYYDSTGTVQSIIVDYTILTITPPFPTTTYDTYHIALAASNQTLKVISKITLPNGLSYNFSYIDPDTGSTNQFGEIMKITLPTGGYVRYKWTTIAKAEDGPPDPNPDSVGLVEELDARRLSDRYISEDGTSGDEKHWNYDYTSGVGIVVTDPLGNKEIHGNFGGQGCNVSGFTPYTSVQPVDPGVEYMDASGKILKRVAYDYGCDAGPVTSAQPGMNTPSSQDYTAGYRNNRLIRTTTTLMDTNQVTKSETDFGDCFSYTMFATGFTDCRQHATQTREYTFGTGTPGSLLRYTTYTYLHNSNSSYLTAHVWDKVSQTSVYDASNTLFASTATSYDTTTISGSSGTVPMHDYTNYSTSNAVRGNPTVVSRWLNTTSSWLTTTNYYNDVGNLVQTTDPGSHTYTLSYADNFTDSGLNGNTQGYVTSVTGPTTNGVNHVEGKQYYYYPGLTAAVCGQNAPSPSACVNTYTPSPTSPVSDYAKYTYDAMGRPYTVTHGDSGTTSFSFTEPSSPSPSSRIGVSSTSAIDSSTNLTNAAVIDGLGRVIQTQLTSDPDGTDLVDTLYDEVGRVSTVSNPHRSSSDTTDGTSTNNYDGFSRTVKLIPPDGSSSSNNVQTYFQGNTTTAVDQTGKARRSITDAQGRLIEVDEPAAGHALPGLAATSASGAVTITGSTQSTSYQQDDGPICTLYDDGGECIHWEEQYETIYVYDSGTVSINANGHTNTVSYNSSSTPATLASSLASAINGDSSAYVTASSSGAVITLTAKTSGAGVYYGVSFSSTFDTTDFTHASYFASSSMLMGGADAVPSFPPSESTASPYVTLYFYDVLNNLICVEQHGNATGQTGCSSASSYDASSSWRVRRFTYNSLGQLLTSKNPESGTSTYTYDSDGNVLTKVSPKPNQTGSATVTTTLTYDALHRVLTKSFDDGTTPSVTIAYDGTTISGCSPTLTVTNGVGRRTAMCDAGGWQAWAYDSRGHVVTERRNTNSVTKSTSYTYNFHGDVTSITYPSGRTVTYTYNAAGQANSAIDVANSITYASNAHYAAPGHLSSLQESGSNIIFTAYYNNRLQPCRISVKSSGTAPTSCTDSAHVGNVLDFTYSFTNGSANNGNVVSITNNINTARSESYTYDELNRISTAQTTATTGTYAWGLSFGYDAWANLLSASVTQGSAYTLSITATGKNQISGLSYDSAGNMTYDGTNSFTFNGEGELASAAGVVYTYDGDGSRVQKATSGTPPTPYKLYWYGVGSDPLSESDASGNISTEYIFLGGQRIAMLNISTSAVSYYVQDHLGSSRVITDASGTPLDDSDFLPYGGERSYLSSSGNHYKFTGKERDTESGLDDFAARFYTSQYGRFLSADDSKYMHPADPQTFNLYSYVANNPINAVDPTGHSPQDPGKYKPYEHGTSPGEEFGVGSGDAGAGEGADVENGKSNSGSDTTTYVYLVTESNGDQSIQFVQATNTNDACAAAMSGPDTATRSTEAAANGGQGQPAWLQNKDVATAIQYLSGSKEMRGVISAFESGHFHISIIHDGNDRYESDSRTVYWDPHSALKTTGGGHQSPALGLGHEMAHATGNRHMVERLSGTPDSKFQWKEERRVILNYENRAAKELGESMRQNHNGTPYYVRCPTCR